MTEFAEINSRLFSLYRNMTFPLNVYAHALTLEEGQVDYLHYGLFHDNDSSLHDAQLHSTHLILNEFPQSPARILEVGVGLGTTLKLLTDKGYQCQGVSPDKNQIEYIQEQWGGNAPVSCQRFEDLPVRPDQYELILFQESAQYIDPISIFNQALDSLTEEGSLLILDEVALTNNQAATYLHTLDYLLALAKRFGFKLVKQLDLSALAAPTLDYLLRVSKKHRQQLLDDLNLTIERLEQLDESNRIYKENYTQGRYGYVLLHFKKEKQPKWRIKPFSQHHFHGLQQLFRLCFKQALSNDLWGWKYAQPDARALCVWEGNELVAHYGGMPRSILYFGEVKRAVQVGDVMVHPSRRGILTRSGPFFLLAATYLEQYIGYAKPFLLGFGFPNERAMKVAEHLGLYREVGHMLEILWPVCASRAKLFTCLRFIDHNNIHHYTETIDILWKVMANDLKSAIVGVRDAAYVQNRYLQHPQHSYQIAVLKNRIGNKAYGIVILNIQAQCCEIVDMIAPLDNIPMLIKDTQRLAAARHCQQLSCQMTANFAALFESTDSDCKTLDIRIPANTWTASPEPEKLNNHWWLMAGDMDFR